MDRLPIGSRLSNMGSEGTRGCCAVMVAKLSTTFQAGGPAVRALVDLDEDAFPKCEVVNELQTFRTSTPSLCECGRAKDRRH
jgi:hypothetical protein